MVGTDYNKFTINVYDVFSNLIPGTVTVVGILFPFSGITFVPNMGLAKGFVVILVSFSIGVGLQGIGSRIKRYHFYPFPSEHKEKAEDENTWESIDSFENRHTFSLEVPTEFENSVNIKISGQDSIPEKSEDKPLHVRIKERVLPLLVRRRVLPFNARMRDISTSNGDLSLAEEKFFKSCNKVMNISGDEIRQWDYLFKMIVSHLETLPSNRTHRIQAQHLATRGLYLSFAFLSVYYILIGIFGAFNWINGLVFSESILFLFALPCLILAHTFYLRSVHFEEDVVKYIICEIYLLSNGEGNT